LLPPVDSIDCSDSLHSMFQLFLGFLAICHIVGNSHGESNIFHRNRTHIVENTIEGYNSYAIHTHVFKETIPLLSSRDDIEKRDRVSHDHIHHVVFVVQQRNMDELTRILHDVSDPLSVNYGQHMSREQVSMMTSNPEARDAVVKYINANGATLVSETLSSEYITASAPISVWERVLNTQFHNFHQTQHDGTVLKVVRAERYWIPKELDEHVESVFNTIQMPLKTHGTLSAPQKIDISSADIHSAAYDFPGYTTPAKIKSFYNVGDSRGSSSSTQCVYATISQYFSPADLEYFQSFLALPDQPLTHSIGGYSNDAKCVSDSSACSESNLDVQYIMATSLGSPTTYWYSDLIFSDWMVTVAHTLNPPLIYSISYGAEESSVSVSEMAAFNTQIIQLLATGITVFVASGDDGAVPRKVRSKGSSSCMYAPLFPASSPYVVSVGATSVS
jgi:tripeptidyl-peptidase I